MGHVGVVVWMILVLVLGSCASENQKSATGISKKSSIDLHAGVETYVEKQMKLNRKNGFHECNGLYMVMTSHGRYLRIDNSCKHSLHYTLCFYVGSSSDWLKKQEYKKDRVLRGRVEPSSYRVIDVNWYEGDAWLMFHSFSFNSSGPPNENSRCSKATLLR